MSMTYKQIADEILALRFDETARPRAKLVINQRYAELWSMEAWTFKLSLATTVATTAGSKTLTSVPADLGSVRAIWRDDGSRMMFLPVQEFWDVYANTTSTGTPEYYTVVNGVVYVGPTASATAATWILEYEKQLTLLANDGDFPAIPAEHHYGLVTGALALMLALANDFTYQFIEQQWQATLQALRADYLSDVAGEAVQYGADERNLPTAW